MTPLSLQTRFFWEASLAHRTDSKMSRTTICEALRTAAGSDSPRLSRAADSALKQVYDGLTPTELVKAVRGRTAHEDEDCLPCDTERNLP